MARGRDKLTTVAVRAKKKPGRYGDGGGLWLQVSNAGTMAWIFRFMLDGRARHMGLGPYPDVTLAEAREAGAQCRSLLRQGIDPIEERLAERDTRRADEAKRIAFKDAAQRFIALHERGWKNAKHIQQWKNTLRDYAYPTLGNRPVSAIDGALITEALSPIWQSKTETANRVKQRIERVVQWVENGMPLPAPSITRRVKHHKALPWGEMPGFMGRLRAMDSISARALEFTILTAVRTGETIGATWDEIDLQKGVWIIPAERMKATREHRVPLSDRAIEILKNVRRERGNLHVFIGARQGQGLSNMTMLQFLRGSEGDGLTVHGFRSSFKDWSAESTSFPNTVSEIALAHKISDATEAAYRRGDLLDKRRPLMKQWARFCESKPGRDSKGSVVGIRGAA